MAAFNERLRVKAGVSSVPRRSLRLLLALLMPVGLAGCLDRYEWHQKLTVVVETPSGEVSGSSIVEIRASYGSQPLSPNEVWYGVTGEATVVEVAPGRYLFALLGGSERRYYLAMRDQIPTKDGGEWLNHITKMKEVAVLEPKNYPMLVTFTNIDNPKTVRKVDPENLAATFGPGFRLREITLEITDDAISSGNIGPIIDWIDWPNERWLGLSTDGRIPMRIQLVGGKTKYLNRNLFKSGN